MNIKLPLLCLLCCLCLYACVPSSPTSLFLVVRYPLSMCVCVSLCPLLADLSSLLRISVLFYTIKAARCKRLYSSLNEFVFLHRPQNAKRLQSRSVHFIEEVLHLKMMQADCFALLQVLQFCQLKLFLQKSLCMFPCFFLNLFMFRVVVLYELSLTVYTWQNNIYGFVLYTAPSSSQIFYNTIELPYERHLLSISNSRHTYFRVQHIVILNPVKSVYS